MQGRSSAFARLLVQEHHGSRVNVAHLLSAPTRGGLNKQHETVCGLDIRRRYGILTIGPVRTQQYVFARLLPSLDVYGHQRTLADTLHANAQCRVFWAFPPALPHLAKLSRPDRRESETRTSDKGSAGDAGRSLRASRRSPLNEG